MLKQKEHVSHQNIIKNFFTFLLFHKENQFFFFTLQQKRKENTINPTNPKSMDPIPPHYIKTHKAILHNIELFGCAHQFSLVCGHGDVYLYIHSKGSCPSYRYHNTLHYTRHQHNFPWNSVELDAIYLFILAHKLLPSSPHFRFVLYVGI